ncbi:uncharacterized protein LOC120689135 [Panicum virgatum]|uniref:uncharacterized protein LOC120689135 n=1 Tax=Panicum virgatum TaxID=38727 RepID=UPI0019D65BAE|nr:uncharacterized protein LOC120689135 [Panicum virgatum]
MGLSHKKMKVKLADAAARLHASVLLLRRWVPSPPPHARVDAALRATGLDGEAELSQAQLGVLAADLFREAVLAGAAEAARPSSRVAPRIFRWAGEGGYVRLGEKPLSLVRAVATAEIVRWAGRQVCEAG